MDDKIIYDEILAEYYNSEEYKQTTQYKIDKLHETIKEFGSLKFILLYFCIVFIFLILFNIINF